MEVKCPDYAPAQRFPEGYLMGVTQGPSNAVAPAATTQLDKAGNISKITILGSDTFDASAVDFSVIDFWPANLTVSSARLQSLFNMTQRHKDLVIDVTGLSLNGQCNQRDILIHGKLADGSEWRAAIPATSPDCIAERQAQKH